MTDKTTPAAVVAASDDDDSTSDALEARLAEVGCDRNKLEDFQKHLGEAIRNGRPQHDIGILLGTVIGRLQVLNNPQIMASFTQGAPMQKSANNKKRAASTDAMHGGRRSKRIETATEARLDARSKETILDVGIGSGIANFDDEDSEDDDEDDEDEDWDDVETDEDNEDRDDVKEEDNAEEDVDPILKQTQKAAQQLESFKTLLKERLVSAKQQIESFLSTQAGSYQANPDEVESTKDIQAAIAKGLSIPRLQKALDEAISRMEFQQAAPDEIHESHLGVHSPAHQNLFTLGMQLAIEESHWLSDTLAAINKSCWFPDMFDSLALHRVEPIFHAMFLPDTFLGNRCSRSKVTCGEVEIGRQVKFRDHSQNLDEVVDGSGKGIGSIVDKGLRNTWDFSQEQTSFAVALVNTDAEMLGNGIEHTKFDVAPIAISSGGMSKGALLTRPESRGVVSDSFHRFAKMEDRWVAAITGSPGIGKSWTLFYALQQALLYDGATVVFFLQESDDVVLYLRRNNIMYAWTSKRQGAADSNLFKRSDVLVLLDPKDAKNGGATFVLAKAKILFAASNNEDHFKVGAHKDHGKIQAFLGPPLDRELDVILPRLNDKLTRRVIEERKSEVGNLIRYILDEEKYTLRKEAITKAIAECTGNQKLFEEIMREEGISVSSKSISESLFAVLPRRPKRLSEIGYDGQNVEYREKVVRAINANVRNAIFNAKRKVILSYWAKVSSDELSQMGTLVEQLFINDLIRSSGMVMKRFQQVKKNYWKESDPLIIDIGTTLKKDVPFSEVCSTVLTEKNVVGVLVAGCPLIDAAGPGRKVYQVTVSPGHDMSIDAMAELGKKLGYIDCDGKVLDRGHAVSEKLEFHWVIPQGRASTWENISPFKFKKGRNNKRRWEVEAVNSFMKEYVEFYVAPLTYKEPITIAESETGIKPW